MVRRAVLRIRAAYIACCVLWGSSWMMIKIGLRDLPPFLFAGSRMILASAVLLPFAIRAGLRGYSRRTWGFLIGLGLLQIGIPYALLFSGQQWVPSALAAVLFATFPVWLALLAHAFLPDQRLTTRNVLAALLGVLGIAVIEIPALGGQTLSPRVAAGGALVVSASMLIAFANVLVRKELRGLPPVVVTFGQVLSGALFLVALASALETGRAASFTPRAAIAVVYLAVFGTVVTYLLFFWLFPRVPMSAIGAIPLLDTSIAVTLGVIVLRERAGWPLFVGGALVLSGAALANEQTAPQVS
ncbi:MAG: DMT family transporter [Myxococcales bacterium]